MALTDLRIEDIILRIRVLAGYTTKDEKLLNTELDDNIIALINEIALLKGALIDGTITIDDVVLKQIGAEYFQLINTGGTLCINRSDDSGDTYAIELARLYINTDDKLYIDLFDRSHTLVVDADTIKLFKETTEILNIDTKNETIILNSKLAEINKTHGFFAFEDATEAISIVTKDIYVQVTNETNDLFSEVQDNAGITLTNDTFVFDDTEITGLKMHRKFEYKLSGFGDANVDWTLRLYNVTQSYAVPVKAIGTTTGANNFITINGIAYDMLGDWGDVYRLEIANNTNTSAFTAKGGSIFAYNFHYTLTA